MQPEIQKSPCQTKQEKCSNYFLSNLPSACAGCKCPAIIYMVMKYDKVYKGVHINNYDVSGMTKDELLLQLRKEFQDKLETQTITLETDKVKEKAGFTDLNVSYDMDKASEIAFKLGQGRKRF